jgi:amino acid efflux transporter
MAQLAGEFRDPARDLPRAMGLAFAVIAALYAALAVATVVVAGAAGSRVPLADLIGAGFGRAGRDATAVLAVALTMGTMNVYIGSTAKLTAALAVERAVPAWLGGDATRSIPRRPLLALALTGALLLGGLAEGVGTTSDFVRATSACFVAVYVLALAAAVRILPGGQRLAAAVALGSICVVGVFSAWYLAVPAVAAGVALVRQRHLREPARGVDVGAAAAGEADRRDLAGDDGDERAQPLRHAGNES